jgi:hypothetical protein
MTEVGRYDGHSVVMDLFELARTVQADKNRAIAAESRRRLLLGPPSGNVAAKPAQTLALRQAQPSTTTGAATR